MAFDFPRSSYNASDGNSINGWSSSPSNGDTASAGGYTFTYNGTSSLWVMNSGQTKSFTGAATYIWDGEKWNASNIPDSSNVIFTTDTPQDGEVIKYVAASNTYVFEAPDLIRDTTPQLGGSLDTNGMAINTTTGTHVTFAGNIQVNGDIDLTGNVDGFNLNNFLEHVVEDTNPQLGGNLDINGTTKFTNSGSGGSLTIDDQPFIVNTKWAGNGTQLVLDSITSLTQPNNGVSEFEMISGVDGESGIFIKLKNSSGNVTNAGSSRDGVMWDHQLGTLKVRNNNVTVLEFDSTGKATFADHLIVDDVEITTTASNKNVKLNPHGTGTIDCSGAVLSDVGTPTAATNAATKGYVDTQITDLIDNSPTALNTLNELAAALGDDANFSTTVTNSIATKLPLSGGTMTGNITFNSTQTFDGRDVSADGSKLDGIDTGAQVNVQSDWNASSGDALILNKPTIPAAYTNSSVDAHLNQSSASSGQSLSWNGSDYAWVTPAALYGNSNVDSHLNTGTANTNQILKWTGSDYDWVDSFANQALVSHDNSRSSASYPVWTTSASGNSNQSLYNSNTIKFYPDTGWIEADRFVGVLQGTASNADTLDNIDSTGFLRSNADDTCTGVVSFQKGIINGYTQNIPDFECLLDFGSDAAGTDKKIIGVTLSTGNYVSVGFAITIIDNDNNTTSSNKAHIAETSNYFVSVSRTDATTQDTPDNVTIHGPGDLITARKTATGAYEICVNNDDQWREYRVSVKGYGTGSSSAATITYHNGDTPGTAAASYTATTTSVDVKHKFLGINWNSATADGYIEFKQGTLRTYDPTVTGTGSDTSTNTAIALGSGHEISGHHDGYIRTLFEWTASADINIGQGGTSLIAGINLQPGSAGLAKVNGKEIVTNTKFTSGANDGTTGAWHLTDSNITAYTDGMTVSLYTDGIAGQSGGTTFEINSLGAVDCYITGNTRLTTHYGPRTLIMLYYDATLDRWYAHDFYYATDDYRMRWQNDVTAGSLITGYQLLMEGTDGKMYPVVTPTASDSGNTKPVQTAELKIDGLMLWYEHSADYAANATITGNYIYESIYATSMEYTHNFDAGWATAHRPWYIVCTRNSNGNFVLDNTSVTSWLTQTLPSSDDSKFYIMGGWMHNDHDAFRLQTTHPIYVYKDGQVQQWSEYAENADIEGTLTSYTGLAAEYVLARNNANNGFQWVAQATGGGGTVYSEENPRDTQNFTSSGTWTKPANCTKMKVLVCGGGGGGGGGAASGVLTAQTDIFHPAHGGGSGIFEATYDISQFGATETVTIGAGGTGGSGSSTGLGSPGSAGGTSSFGSVVAYGGQGGHGAQKNTYASGNGAYDLSQSSAAAAINSAPGADVTHCYPSAAGIAMSAWYQPQFTTKPTYSWNVDKPNRGAIGGGGWDYYAGYTLAGIAIVPSAIPGPGGMKNPEYSEPNINGMNQKQAGSYCVSCSNFTTQATYNFPAETFTCEEYCLAYRMNGTNEWSSGGGGLGIVGGSGGTAEDGFDAYANSGSGGGGGGSVLSDTSGNGGTGTGGDGGNGASGRVIVKCW